MLTPNATAYAFTTPVRHRARRIATDQLPHAASKPSSSAEQFSHLGGRDLSLEWHDPGCLLPYERNPRTHSRKQIEQIAASIREFGFTNPVLIDGEGRIIAGHGRVAAAKLLGMDRVPTIRLEHLSEAQKRAYIIADNRLAELAGWDEALLAIELRYLAEIDFTVELTGFATAEIDLVIGRRSSRPNLIRRTRLRNPIAAVRASCGPAISGCSTGIACSAAMPAIRPALRL